MTGPSWDRVKTGAERSQEYRQRQQELRDLLGRLHGLRAKRLRGYNPWVSREKLADWIGMLKELIAEEEAHHK